jgi:hypothetical protein
MYEFYVESMLGLMLDTNTRALCSFVVMVTSTRRCDIPCIT